jgi:hypothetical protein
MKLTNAIKNVRNNPANNIAHINALSQFGIIVVSVLID